MLVTTDALCEALPMLNLHPALPDGPIGTWQEVIRELIARGASESGMMLQRVTTELDRGPVVSVCRYPIGGDFDAIRATGVARESSFVIETLRAIATGTIELERLAEPVDLTAAVEAALSRG